MGPRATASADGVIAQAWGALSRNVVARFMLGVFITLSMFALGVAAGNWMSDNNFRAMLSNALSDARSEDDVARTQSVAWRRIETALHDLDVATIRLHPFTSKGRGGAIDEIAGGILFVSPLGDFGYLSPTLELERVELHAPINLDALRASPIYKMPGFNEVHFRVLDLMVVDRGEARYEIFVSHHRYVDNCIEVVVSATTLTRADGALRSSGDWRDVFVSQPCLPVREGPIAFEGAEAGGRMIMLDPQTMLLTLGDVQFNGVDANPPLAQDPKSAYGKILKLDLKTGRATPFSFGHRNPQGLTISRDGTIWSTEHGPKGGDEINIIKEGRHYGWPFVTYGDAYGESGQRKPWPLNPVQGRHDKYERPAHAFVPSIGISSIVEPDPREFPLWKDHLLFATLYTGKLAIYLVRIENGVDVAYVEPITIDEVGRDMIVMKDGRIAFLTDAGALLFIRNAAGADQKPLEVRASEALVAQLSQPASQPATALTGDAVFRAKCATCHSLVGAQSVGPPLDGVLGRRVGAAPGYRYSPALHGHQATWSQDLIARYLAEPSRTFPGTTMPPVPLKREEEDALLAYLKGAR